MIIIKTPQPDTEERLVLVPLDAVSRTEGGDALLTIRTANARDATPADLERAGYVMREPGDYYSQWAAERDRARKAESDLAEVRELQRSDERDGNVGFSLTCWVESILEQLNVARINRTELGKAAGQYARERDEQRDRAARAERGASTLAAALETERGLTEKQRARAETAERERDDAVAAHRSALAEQTARADTNFRAALKVQGDMTDLRVALSAAESANEEAGELLAAETARAEKAEAEAKDLRAELARLTLVDEEEPTVSWFYDTYCARPESTQQEDCADAYRLGVAHERARQQPEKGRATDEELVAIADGIADGLRAIILAVAARVRQERCLVAQAVARGWYIYLCPQKNDPSKWDIETGRVIAGRSDGGAILHGVPASDVPATLARLLGEVEK